MNDIADLLMLSGVERSCPDCLDERIFVPAAAFPSDDTGTGTGEYCCTVCGAALLVDPHLDARLPPRRSRVA